MNSDKQTCSSCEKKLQDSSSELCQKCKNLLYYKLDHIHSLYGQQ